MPMQRLYKKEHGAHICGDLSLHTGGADGSPSPGNIPFLFPQSPPLQWWELKGPRRKCKVRFAHLEKPTGWEDPECFPRVWSCLELCPSASPNPAQPPDHPLQAQLNSPLSPHHHPVEIFLTDFTDDDLSRSASWNTGNNSSPSSFQSPCV